MLYTYLFFLLFLFFFFNSEVIHNIPGALTHTPSPSTLRGATEGLMAVMIEVMHLLKYHHLILFTFLNIYRRNNALIYIIDNYKVCALFFYDSIKHWMFFLEYFCLISSIFFIFLTQITIFSLS